MKKTRAQLKAEAKGLLRGNWGKAIGMLFLPFLLCYSIFVMIGLLLYVLMQFIALTSSQGADHPLIGIIILLYLLSFLALAIVTCLINVGISYNFLDYVRTGNPAALSFDRAFRCLRKKSIWPTFKILFLNRLFLNLWTCIPIAGIFIVVVKHYSYEQSFYVYQDSHDKSLPAASYITGSRMLMNGHKKDRFVLDLSFFGWYLLINLTLGIAAIWVLPYYYLTVAGFYHELSRNKANPEARDDFFYQVPQHFG